MPISPPTDAQTLAARAAYSLTDAQLAHELTLAACPSHELADELRAAFMVEAGARLRRRTPEPLWIDRYRAAERADLLHTLDAHVDLADAEVTP